MMQRKLISSVLIILLVSALTSILYVSFTLLDRGSDFSELSFVDHASLPRTAVPGTEQTFAFMISNRGGTKESYHVKAMQITGSSQSLLYEKEVSLLPGASQILAARFTAASSPQRISGSAGDLEIHFEVEP